MEDRIGNNGLANFVGGCGGITNTSLMRLTLANIGIVGAEGGQQVALLLQRFPNLIHLNLMGNRGLGHLGASALAPCLATAKRLEELDCCGCGFGDVGVANLIPHGQANRSLTVLHFDSDRERDIRPETIITLVARCTNLDHLSIGFVVFDGNMDLEDDRRILNPDERRRLKLLLDRKSLHAKASALAGSPFPVLFRFVEQEAHCHEHGLSAIFVILQSDGDDYFCNAHNRAIG